MVLLAMSGNKGIIVHTVFVSILFCGIEWWYEVVGRECNHGMQLWVLLYPIYDRRDEMMRPIS